MFSSFVFSKFIRSKTTRQLTTLPRSTTFITTLLLSTSFLKSTLKWSSKFTLLFFSASTSLTFTDKPFFSTVSIPSKYAQKSKIASSISFTAHTTTFFFSTNINTILNTLFITQTKTDRISIIL